ncbi:MAG TPA: tetratricopeptide repeat protein [Chloroflexi bacterium]|nr:tetratricopeptide repeat protein [Chloroflexota bacterium]
MTTKYNPQKTVKLAEVRETAGLTQDQAAAYFGLKGKKRRDTIGGWERGQSRPGLKHRARFITYLWDKLGLRRNRRLFWEIWRETAVTEWGWSPLGEGELPDSLAPQPEPTAIPLSGPFLAPPLPPYELVGRSELLQTLKQKLLSSNRQPIALTGLPGAGKTALALALAYNQDILAYFRDGILWAGLGSNPAIFSLLNRWGEAVGITPQEMAKAATVSDKSQRLHDAIGKRRMLLVIDDAWRLEDALPFQIGGPNCGILLTTRRPNLARDFAEDNILAISELDKTGGIVLFTWFAPHVAAAMPSVVESLVTVVGGLPLAIQLMARYARRHAGEEYASLQQTLQRLRDEKTRLTLTQPQRPADPHPSLIPSAALSLSAALRISAAALDEQARHTLWALSVFPPKPDTFSAEAVWKICAADQASLAALVNYGLLEPSGPERYTLHQTISDFAQFADGRPAGKQQILEETAARHAAHYKTILQKARELYEQGGNNVYRGLELFNRELGNIRAGQQWAEKHSLADENTARLCSEYPVAGGFLLHLRLSPQENFRWWQSGLTAARQIENRELAAKNLANLGLVYRQMGRVRQSIVCYKEALALFDSLADRKNKVRVLNNLGAACKSLSEFQQAIDYHQQALSLARQLGDREQEGDAIANLGVVYKNLKQYEKAIQYQQKALHIARETGHEYGEMTSLIDLGAAYSENGDPAQAVKFYEEALDKSRILGDLENEGTILCNLGVASMDTGDAAQAIAWYRQALDIDVTLENRLGELVTRHNLGEAYEKLGEYEIALQFYNESLSLARETGDKLGQGEALWRSARLLFQADQAKAVKRAREALDIFTEIGDSRVTQIRKWLSCPNCRRFSENNQPNSLFGAVS